MVSEWAEYGSLKELHENFDNCWTRKIQIIRDICRGILFLYDVNIFHHDIRYVKIFCFGMLIWNFVMKKSLVNQNLLKTYHIGLSYMRLFTHGMLDFDGTITAKIDDSRVSEFTEEVSIPDDLFKVEIFLDEGITKKHGNVLMKMLILAMQ
ncbi:hypothetical protein C2G38_2040988 [Gigaspora rosea]|uniref:Protein kinase domain-containing protein n=1 Tax=Gigaspora rosea TaxID=44941 RepID=A0A397UXG6_9GLOM|nr:hypothetical protein C2G38_2040988 [Gigaspora rosea]